MAVAPTSRKKNKKYVNPDEILAYLTESGVPINHALGVLANIKHESNFNPNAVGDKGSSAGLFQHHKSRKDGLLSYVNNDLSDWRGQIDYMLTEKGTEKFLSKDFNTPEEASYWFTKNWERPADADRRAVERQSWLKSYKGGKFSTGVYNPNETPAEDTPINENESMGLPAGFSVKEDEGKSWSEADFEAAVKKEIKKQKEQEKKEEESEARKKLKELNEQKKQQMLESAFNQHLDTVSKYSNLERKKVNPEEYVPSYTGPKVPIQEGLPSLPGFQDGGETGGEDPPENKKQRERRLANELFYQIQSYYKHVDPETGIVKKPGNISFGEDYQYRNLDDYNVSPSYANKSEESDEGMVYRYQIAGHRFEPDMETAVDTELTFDEEGNDKVIIAFHRGAPLPIGTGKKSDKYLRDYFYDRDGFANFKTDKKLLGADRIIPYFTPSEEFSDVYREYFKTKVEESPNSEVEVQVENEEPQYEHGGTHNPNDPNVRQRVNRNGDLITVKFEKLGGGKFKRTKTVSRDGVVIKQKVLYGEGAIDDPDYIPPKEPDTRTKKLNKHAKIDTFEDGGVISSHGWEYKKEGDQYLTRREGSKGWIVAKGQALDSIKQKVFNESDYTDEQKKADYIRRVQGMIDSGSSIDDLVNKRIGTREGLMSLFGDQLSERKQVSPQERKKGSEKSFEFPSIHGDLYKQYAGAMSKVFNNRKNRFIQPDISMVGWQSAPKTVSATKPKTSSGKSAQDVFDKHFEVTDKSNYEKVEERVENAIQSTKGHLKERGFTMSKKDEEDVRQMAWFTEGVRSLNQMGLPEIEAKIKQAEPEEPGFFESIMGSAGKAMISGPDYKKVGDQMEDYVANFENYAKRLLVKKGLADAGGKVIEIKETDLVKGTNDAPETFYEEIASVQDNMSSNPDDMLASFRNQWDNSQGFTYINTPAKSSKRDRNKTYENVQAVGHFILDASPLNGSTYMHGNNFNYINSAINNDEYLPIFENIKGSEGRVNMKYKRPSEMTTEELKAVEKFKRYNKKASGGNKNKIAKNYADAIDTDKYKIVAPLRQLKFDDIDFGSSSHAAGFKRARVVNTIDGKPTNILFTNANRKVYGRFDGVTVSFVFKDKNGNTVVRDYTGPIKGVQEEGKSIKKTYGLSEGDLTIGYHDVGSFSAKPQARDGKLSISQWDGFNNESGTGSALIIPK